LLKVRKIEQNLVEKLKKKRDGNLNAVQKTAIGKHTVGKKSGKFHCSQKKIRKERIIFKNQEINVKDQFTNLIGTISILLSSPNRLTIDLFLQS